MSNLSINVRNLTESEKLVLYALHRLEGIATISEIKKYLDKIGYPLSRGHVDRIVKDLERKYQIVGRYLQKCSSILL